jgi:surfactin synthase thioesterase subunit
VSRRIVWAHDYAESVARLVVFPHAGCGAAPYVKLARGLTGRIAVAIVRLPARESRLDEPALTTMEELVAECAAAVSVEVRPPFALLGHCSGAWTAYETARALAADVNGPEVLYVTGDAPSTDRSEPSIDHGKDGELMRFLELAGHTPTDVLTNPELLDFVLPALRADLEVMASYQRRPDHVLDCPVVVTDLIDHHGPTTATLTGWQRCTSKPVRSQPLSGCHSSLWEATRTLLELLAADLGQQYDQSGAA